MSRKVRSAITLSVMTVVILVGATWAWAALTNPFPEGGLFGGGQAPEEEVCTPLALSAGDTLSTNQVTVTVLNAGSTAGAAAGTLAELVDDAGFAEGLEGNAPEDTDVEFVQIWTDDPSNPSVRLLRTWLGEDTLVVERDLETPGVHVVVGDRFGDLVDGRESVTVQRDVEVCGPANEG